VTSNVHGWKGASPNRGLSIGHVYSIYPVARIMPIGHTYASMQRNPLDVNSDRAAKLLGIHVLVIHDDQSARHYLRSVLETSGAIVTAAAAAAAIRVALIADVIVCDLESAERAGSEFLSQLRSLHVRLGRSVPAIALVPNGTRRARERSAGFVGFLMNPVDGDELRATVLEAASQ
jgi:CheY-like chemotaxis protein